MFKCDELIGQTVPHRKIVQSGAVGSVSGLRVAWSKQNLLFLPGLTAQDLEFIHLDLTTELPPHSVFNLEVAR